MDTRVVVQPWRFLLYYPLMHSCLWSKIWKSAVGVASCSNCFLWKRLKAKWQFNGFLCDFSHSSLSWFPPKAISSMNAGCLVSSLDSLFNMIHKLFLCTNLFEYFSYNCRSFITWLVRVGILGAQRTCWSPCASRRVSIWCLQRTNAWCWSLYTNSSWTTLNNNTSDSIEHEEKDWTW